MPWSNILICLLHIVPKNSWILNTKYDFGHFKLCELMIFSRSQNELNQNSVLSHVTCFYHMALDMEDSHDIKKGRKLVGFVSSLKRGNRISRREFLLRKHDNELFKNLCNLQIFFEHIKKYNKLFQSFYTTKSCSGNYGNI